MAKRFWIYTERQRREIEKYLNELPNAMPSYVRQLRMAATEQNFPQAFDDLETDFEQARADLGLMKRLAELEVPIGRKKKGYGDLRASTMIRKTEARDTKAEFEVKKK